MQILPAEHPFIPAASSEPTCAVQHPGTVLTWYENYKLTTYLGFSHVTSQLRYSSIALSHSTYPFNHQPRAF